MHRIRLIYCKRAVTKYKLSVLQNVVYYDKFERILLVAARQKKPPHQLLISCFIHFFELIALHLKLHEYCVKFMYNCVHMTIFGIENLRKENGFQIEPSQTIFKSILYYVLLLVNCHTFDLESSL